MFPTTGVGFFKGRRGPAMRLMGYPWRDLQAPSPPLLSPAATVAEDTAPANQRDVLGQRYRLLEMQTRAVDAARGIAVAEREVLQRALPALVADRAVERVVDELELEDVRARLHRHRALRPHDHAFRDRRRAGRLRARRTGRKIDEAQAARADGVELVVVAEDGDLDPDGLGRLDDERAGRHAELLPVDREIDIRHSPQPFRRCTRA